jgi:hypothetical protein
VYKHYCYLLPEEYRFSSWLALQTLRTQSFRCRVSKDVSPHFEDNHKDTAIPGQGNRVANLAVWSQLYLKKLNPNLTPESAVAKRVSPCT